MKEPLVTIISPCYNHEKYVIESLESIKNQTYNNLEHIIIDDCSTDNSVSVIQNWIAENNYSCIFIQHKKNKGISETLNESINLTKGKYWTALATDDVIKPERTEMFVNFLENDPSSNMVVSDCDIIDGDSKPTLYQNNKNFIEFFTQYHPHFNVSSDFGTYPSLLSGNYIPGSLMVKRSVFDIVGLFNPKLIVEDWSMWLNISYLHKIGFIDKKLTAYRVHNTNSINVSNAHHRDAVATLLSQHEKNVGGKYWNSFKEAYSNIFFHNYRFFKNNEVNTLFKNGPKQLFIQNYLKFAAKACINKIR